MCCGHCQGISAIGSDSGVGGRRPLAGGRRLPRLSLYCANRAMGGSAPLPVPCQDA